MPAFFIDVKNYTFEKNFRKMIKNLLLVGIGGFIGSVARYLVSKGMSQWGASGFPAATFTANIAGCFLIGIFYALSTKGELFSSSWRLFLMVGICGGFTTFSSFALENMVLLRNHDYILFLLNAIGSLALGIIATVGGFALIQKWG